MVPRESALSRPISGANQRCRPPWFPPFVASGPSLAVQAARGVAPRPRAARVCRLDPPQRLRLRRRSARPDLGLGQVSSEDQISAGPDRRVAGQTHDRPTGPNRQCATERAKPSPTRGPGLSWARTVVHLQSDISWRRGKEPLAANGTDPPIRIRRWIAEGDRAWGAGLAAHRGPSAAGEAGRDVSAMSVGSNRSQCGARRARRRKQEHTAIRAHDDVDSKASPTVWEQRDDNAADPGARGLQARTTHQARTTQ